MTPQNLAIVIGPNLFTTPANADPMASLVFSQKVAQFMQQAILWRLHDLEQHGGPAQAHVPGSPATPILDHYTAPEQRHKLLNLITQGGAGAGAS